MITLGVLVVVMIVAAFELVTLGGGGGGDGGGGDGDPARAASRPTVGKTAPTTRPTPPTTGPPINYQVQRGDTLSIIARRYGVSMANIVAANHLADQDRLVAGQMLVIPPRPPIELLVTPAATTAGRRVELTLTGARPSEDVTFEVTSPSGTFAGPPHTAPSNGTVTATYTPPLDAPTGTYNVVAKGNEGTTAEVSFRVDVAAPIR